jgi:hypothetical protein
VFHKFPLLNSAATITILLFSSIDFIKKQSTGEKVLKKQSTGEKFSITTSSFKGGTPFIPQLLMLSNGELIPELLLELNLLSEAD